MSERTDERPSAAPDDRPESAYPAWRRDFPIDWPQDHYVARRDFSKFLILTSLAFAVGQLWIGVQSWFRRGRGSYPRQRIATLDQVPVGGALVFRYPGAQDVCLLIRPNEDPGSLLAYSQKCTHLSCAVVPRVQEQRLYCPCHHGWFDLASGRPVAGPPRRPLPRIQLAITDGIVYALGVEAPEAREGPPS